MKIKAVLKKLAVPTVFWTLTTVVCADVIDFNSKPALSHHGRGTKIEYKTMKDLNNRKAILPALSWNDKHGKWLGFGLKAPVGSKLLSAPLNATISIPVHTNTPDAFKTVHLWMKDQENGEVKWKQRVSLKKGWNNITFLISNRNFYLIQRKKNKNISFPLKFFGIGFVFKNQNVPSGSITFANISINGIDSKRLAVNKKIWYFDNREKWHISRSFKLVPEKNGLLVSAKSVPDWNGKALSGKLTEKFFKLKDYGSPVKIQIVSDLISGSGVTVALTLRDAQGEYFALRQKKLKAGCNILTWNTATDKVGNWGKHKNKVIDSPIFLVAINIHQYPAPEPAKLLFKSGMITENLFPLQAVDVDIVTDNPVHVLKVGTENKLAVMLTNRALTQNNFLLKLDLKNFAGKHIVLEKEFTLDPGETTKWHIPWDKNRSRGIWWLHYQLSTKKKNIRHGQLSFSYMSPAGPNREKNPDFQLGMCTRQSRWSWRDQKTEALACALIGVKLVRTGYQWGCFEPQEGKWNFKKMDELMALNESYYMSTLYLIAYTPRWAAPNERLNSKDWNDWNKAAPRLDALNTFVRKIAARYNGRICYWEFWNEPDLSYWRGSLKQYITCLKTVYQALKQVNPKNKLICGGFAFAEHPHAKKGFHAAVIRDAQQWFDYHGYHQHGDFMSFKQTINGKLSQIRKSLKSPKPLFFTETGFHTTGDNQAQQAVNVVKKIVFAWGSGAKGYIWFDMRNDGLNPANCEYNYGLMSNDFYPKAGYAAYNALTKQLGQAKFVKKLGFSSDSSSYLFKDGDKQIIVIWKNDSAKADELITFVTDARDAYAIDIMGNRYFLKINQKKIAVPLKQFPIYIVLEHGIALPKLSTPLISFPVHSSITVPGKVFSLKTIISNPFSHPVKFTLLWELPPSFSVRENEQILSIPGNTKKIFVKQIKVAKTCRKALVVTKLHYRIKPGKLTGKCNIPVNIAVPISTEKYSSKPQFVFKSKKYVVNLMEHNPYTAHRTWKGPQDQSAEVWLSCRDNSLGIKIKVKDDIHYQISNAAGSYRGDGIQLAFKIPGQNKQWEIGLARLKSGSSGVHTWIKPDEYQNPSSLIELRTSRENKITTYIANIPLKTLHIDRNVLKNGIRFNMIINENDGEGRDGWLQLAPGIGEAKNTEKYPVIILK